MCLTKANRKKCREWLQEADSTVHLALPKLNMKRTLMKAGEGGTEQSLRLNHSAAASEKRRSYSNVSSDGS